MEVDITEGEEGMPPKRKLPPDDEVVGMYRGGMSCPEIAEATGAAPETVMELLRRVGEPRRSLSDAKRLSIAKGRSTSPSYWSGRTQPPEMVEKRLAATRGDKHYAYKDGRSIRQYRNLILRTGGKVECTKCQSTEKLVIHHRDLDHYNDAPDNLEVLCNACHSSLHKTLYWAAKARAQARKQNPSGIVLTDRQREVLIQLADGLTLSEIAARMVLARSTVRAHLDAAMTKLGAKNRTNAVWIAVRIGELGLEQMPLFEEAW